ncbi:MAG: phage tail protein [Salibacteraceae bacterium]
MDPFLGQVVMFGGNFAPRGWAYCDGQLLSIAQNQALFSILGTIYGGDGRTTFALPDLRGRTPIHPGHGPGLSTFKLGQRSGMEYVNLNSNNLPPHTHTADITPLTFTPFVQVNENEAEEVFPANQYIATAEAGRNLFASSGTPGAKLNGTVAGLTGTLQIANQGGSQATYIMQPWEAVHYIIALIGTFPSRN